MNNLKEYLNQEKTLSFKNLLFQFIDEQEEKDSVVYNRANIDRRLFSKIRCFDNYIPKKENIIKICFALKLDLSSTLKLLESAGYYLSTNNNFDLVIRYCLNNNIYNLDAINNYLEDNCDTVLI